MMGEKFNTSLLSSRNDTGYTLADVIRFRESYSCLA